MNAKTTATKFGVDAEIIAKHLRSVSVGVLVRYADLSRLVSRDVTGEARGALNSARRAMLAEGFRFDVVRGEGIKRMSDSEIALSGGAIIRSDRTRNERNKAKLAVIRDLSVLTAHEKVQYGTAMAVLGVMSHFLGVEQVKVIEAKVSQTSQHKLPVADSIDEVRKALEAKFGGKP